MTSADSRLKNLGMLFGANAYDRKSIVDFTTMGGGFVSVSTDRFGQKRRKG